MVTEQRSNKLRVKLIKSVQEGFSLPDTEQALHYITPARRKVEGEKACSK